MSPAVTRLAPADCTVPEICAITGHSNEEANAIHLAHDLHSDTQIAWNAVKLDALDADHTIVRAGRRRAPDCDVETEVETATPVLLRRTSKAQ